MLIKLLKKHGPTVTIAFILTSIFWWYFADNLFAGSFGYDFQLLKFNYLLKKIRDDYVEPTDVTKLMDGAITGMLESLDPHSVYIPVQEQSRISEQFAGEFEGIGISFVIQNKILTVISPIPGTPADKLGIRAGDRIIEIDGQSAYGITNEQVFEKLRGPKGTSVEVTIDRPGETETLKFTIIRDKIPIHSVETSFMLDDKTGYILLNQFTSNTSAELDEALQSLEKQGMTQLIFDLRGNSGGYLDQAVKVVDKFIAKGERIVYTKGRNPASERSYYATGSTHPNFDLIVLLNHGSASASEIVAGAVQDLDRGLVAGSRSFGKGLVQSPYPFDDGSVVRLTTARYYTPSGRLIQRPYDKNISDYYMDGLQDESEDSIKVTIDSTKEVYYTKAGRTVYGGGGIEPDVKLKTSYFTSYTPKLLNKRLFFELAADYAAKNPQWGGDFTKFQREFQVSEDMLNQLVKLAAAKDIPFEKENYQKDLPYIKTLLKAEIAQNLYNGRLYYYQVRILSDEQVQEAVKLFPQAREIAALRKTK